MFQDLEDEAQDITLKILSEDSGGFTPPCWQTESSDCCGKRLLS